MKIVALGIILFSCLASSLADQKYSVHYDENTGSWKVEKGLHKDWVAWAVYDREMLTIGWDKLTVTSNRHKNDTQQAYAAGYIEVR
jgi:hypothetical protein